MYVCMYVCMHACVTVLNAFYLHSVLIVDKFNRLATF